MDKPFDLMSIIEQWQVDHCKETVAKRSGDTYYQVPISRRRELLTILVSQIRAYGKPKDFFTNSRRDEIVREIIPRGKHLERSMIEGFRDATKKQLNWVILEVYSTDENLEHIVKELTKEESKKPIKKLHDKNKYTNIDEPPVTDTVDEEMAALLGLKEDE